MDETKICKSCGRERPLSAFRKTRWGGTANSCNECIAEKNANTRYDRVHAQRGGGNNRPFSDPDFDNLSVGEVVRLMGRAKKWLESRNCRIKLYGDFIETKTKKLKFE